MFMIKTKREGRVLRVLQVIAYDRVNFLKPKTYFMYPTSLTYRNSVSAHNEFMCFAWISEQTAIISPYSINLSVFIT
jgi:hypothetical protein